MFFPFGEGRGGDERGCEEGVGGGEVVGWKEDGGGWRWSGGC